MHEREEDEGGKERLEHQLEKARAELRRLERKLESEVDYGVGEGDPRTYEREMNLVLRRGAEAKVSSIEEALHRLGEGTYGLCARCGREIKPERLAILPDTDRCARCAP